jgi:hypothetical protein
MERHQYREGRGGRDRKPKFAVISSCSEVALTLLSSCSFSGMEVEWGILALGIGVEEIHLGIGRGPVDRKGGINLILYRRI